MKVVLLRGAGMQGGSRGSISRVGVFGQLLNCRHSKGELGGGIEKVGRAGGSKVIEKGGGEDR